MINDPNEWTNVASKPENAAIIENHKKWIPKIDLPPAPNSASRVLTYDKKNRRGRLGRQDRETQRPDSRITSAMNRTLTLLWH